MHAKSHASLMDLYYQFLPIIFFFTFFIVGVGVIIGRIYFLFVIWLGLIIFASIDILWHLPVYCDTPNCHSVMSKTRIPTSNKEAQVTYICISCGNEYKTKIYYRQPRDTNIPGEW